MPYGVFTGQLHRFMRICSSPAAFVRNSCEVALRLISQKSLMSRLRRSFCAFTRSNISRSRWGVTASALNRLFLDCLMMRLPEDTTGVDDSPAPRTNSMINGLAWLTQNFPSLVSMSSHGDISHSLEGMCNHVASRHLSVDQLRDCRQPRRPFSRLASVSRGLRWLRVNFPSVGPLGSGYV